MQHILEDINPLPVPRKRLWCIAAILLALCAYPFLPFPDGSPLWTSVPLVSFSLLISRGLPILTPLLLCLCGAVISLTLASAPVIDNEPRVNGILICVALAAPTLVTLMLLAGEGAWPISRFGGINSFAYWSALLSMGLVGAGLLAFFVACRVGVGRSAWGLFTIIASLVVLFSTLWIAGFRMVVGKPAGWACAFEWFPAAALIAGGLSFSCLVEYRRQRKLTALFQILIAAKSPDPTNLKEARELSQPIHWGAWLLRFCKRRGQSRWHLLWRVPLLLVLLTITGTVIVANLPPQTSREVYLFQACVFPRSFQKTYSYLRNIPALFPPEDYTGIWRRWYANGKILTLTNYQKGVSQGRQLFWDIDGSMIQTTSYKNGKLDGREVTWVYPVRKRTSFYRNGEMTLRQVESYRAGGILKFVRQTRAFAADLMRSKQWLLYPNGSPQEFKESKYSDREDNTLDGISAGWSANGTLRYCGIYKNDVPWRGMLEIPKGKGSKLISTIKGYKDGVEVPVAVAPKVPPPIFVRQNF